MMTKCFYAVDPEALKRRLTGQAREFAVMSQL
jgi:hypothetical protein